MEYFLFATLYAVALGFALINGMNDLSGIIAPVAATRALPVRAARRLAVVGLWSGVLLGQGQVAQTIALKMVDLTHHRIPAALELVCWLGGVAGALLWGLAARRAGIPTSATHAFIGSLCGATLAAAAHGGLVNWGLSGLIEPPHRIVGTMKVLGGLLLSPMIGLVLGYLVFKTLAAVFRYASAAVNEKIQRMERVGLFLQCFSYGANDAQAIMGLLTGGMISASLLPPDGSFYVPLAVKTSVAAAYGMGATIGSMQIMRKVGKGLYRMRPADALSGQLAASCAVYGAAVVGAPVSSTQVMSSALVGVGGAWRPRHVRWQRFREMLFTWVITFPGALLVGYALATALKALVARGGVV